MSDPPMPGLSSSCGPADGDGAGSAAGRRSRARDDQHLGAELLGEPGGQRRPGRWRRRTGRPSAAADHVRGRPDRQPAAPSAPSRARCGSPRRRSAGRASAKAQAACSMARRPMRRCASVAAGAAAARAAPRQSDERVPPARPARRARPRPPARASSGREVDHPRPGAARRRRGAAPTGRSRAAALRQPRADDLDARARRGCGRASRSGRRPARRAVGEAARGDPLGQRLEQVDPLGGQLVLDRLGDGVVGDHLVDVVVLGRGVVRHLEHDVEADALGDAALGAEGADLDLRGCSRAPRCGRAAGRHGWRSPARAAARRRSRSRPWHPRPCPVVIAPPGAAVQGRARRRLTLGGFSGGAERRR